MLFKKKKQEEPAKTKLPVPEDIRSEMYQAILQTMKTALSDPSCQYTPEALFEKICPPGFFTEEDCAKLLAEAKAQK
ncbi:MAG: hypothetical protein IKG82_13505 [Oscillospiraceae bacterium]|nr:hypothetical protein [Oscillospiraceae bacterium]